MSWQCPNGCGLYLQADGSNEYYRIKEEHAERCPNRFNNVPKTTDPYSSSSCGSLGQSSSGKGNRKGKKG